MFDKQALAKLLQEKADELHEIGDALESTNALRGRRIIQIARSLEGTVQVLLKSEEP